MAGVSQPAPRWRPGAGGAAAADRAAARRRKIVWVVGALLAVAGALAAWLCYPRPFRRPYFLGLWIDQYEQKGLPPRLWARPDRAALRALPWEGNNAFT